jgi:hypothetical protein
MTGEGWVIMPGSRQSRDKFRHGATETISKSGQGKPCPYKGEGHDWVKRGHDPDIVPERNRDKFRHGATQCGVNPPLQKAAIKEEKRAELL